MCCRQEIRDEQFERLPGGWAAHEVPVLHGGEAAWLPLQVPHEDSWLPLRHLQFHHHHACLVEVILRLYVYRDKIVYCIHVAHTRQYNINNMLFQLGWEKVQRKLGTI